jgi:cell division protein FtsB
MNPRRTASSRTGRPVYAKPAATPSTRPAAAARGGRPPQGSHAPRSIRNLAILASVFVVLGITLIPTVRSTLSQRAQINGLRDTIAAQRRSVTALEQLKQQWKDPAYVEQQARQRLKFVRVGEKSFTVIDGDPTSVLPGGAQIVAPVRSSTSAWYDQLWQSMVTADNPASTASGQQSSAPGAP